MLKLYLRMYVFRGSMAKTKSIKNDKRFKIYDQVITFFLKGINTINHERHTSEWINDEEKQLTVTFDLFLYFSTQALYLNV